ncbi:hypothetical protein NP493_1348g00035 [Ridgeia piscesae]|uniref:DNA mismatch repair proteins mutS family domain-containing protein n=1 Tax=Ridgeia piscesae TaxID=27915 RepID=A0AAD9K7G0_RIDPI|nr:hypothetical protein NP493_1348g00035 [Ridgeia piscesae]
MKYRPVDCPLKGSDADTVPKQEPTFPAANQHMVLDAATMMNLDLIQNGTTATLEGTLLGTLDLCVTPFGKRLFKQWLCAPLCHPVAIGDRLDAVEDLMQASNVTSEMTDLLRKLPDLERLISRIHTLGSANRMKSHPDSRAIFFEEVTYSKRKIEDFLAALSGFRTAMTAVEQLQTAAPKFKSTLLRRTVTFEEGEGEGRFPDLTEMLKFFNSAFDHDKAKTAGVITPTKGVDPDYDTAIEDIKETRQELDTYLDKQKQRLGCRTLSYWGLGKNRFQIEVPDSAVKNVPRDYEVASQKKGFRRYRTATVDRLLATLVEAEEKRDVAIKDSMRRIFAAFDKNYTKWQMAVQCLSVLDALRSLSEYSKCATGGALCRPEFVMSCDQPLLEIRDGRHPCISHTFAGTDFIPNDTVIGTAEGPEDDTSDDSQVVLVTGPNMGGKSTLMRQVGIIVVMAQLGCYVPASKCRLSPVDRAFTRLGACDRIMAGESTFFVELSETSAILQHATRHSLVLLDELGRGTATYDGTAIACAVVNELSTNVRCRTLFSTHYHSLVEEFSHDSNVRLGHMACMVENENSDDPSQETITFLYKFVSGACPKSYGFNAARLANIPDDIVKVAHMKAKQLELTTEQLKMFRTVFATEDVSKISTLLETIEA